MKVRIRKTAVSFRRGGVVTAHKRGFGFVRSTLRRGAWVRPRTRTIKGW